MTEKFTNIERPSNIELEVRTARRKLLAEMEVQGLSEIDALDDIVDYANSMKAKYPDTYQRVRTYHVLIGSSIPHETVDLVDDFPGQDSVLNFLDQLRKKYLKEKTV